MIRCHKCGYSNLYNAKQCIKCRTNLANKEGAEPDVADLTNTSRKTVVMTNTDALPWEQEKPAPVIRPNNRPVGGFQTVRRVVPDPDSCYLAAISLDEEKELRKIDISGKAVSLTRAVLDPGNNSISRNGHANIYQKDGQWYVENVTDLKTTFVQVKQPVKLSDGDVILMGDSLFKFRMGKTDE